jgi:hypothetical protein
MATPVAVTGTCVDRLNSDPILAAFQQPIICVGKFSAIPAARLRHGSSDFGDVRSNMAVDNVIGRSVWSSGGEVLQTVKSPGNGCAITARKLLIRHENPVVHL